MDRLEKTPEDSPKVVPKPTESRGGLLPLQRMRELPGLGKLSASQIILLDRELSDKEPSTH